MQFIKHDLGELSAGATVEITLTNAAYVRLMDSENIRMYRYGQLFESYGGYAKRSPVKLKIPYAGHWFVAVDLAGYAGTVGSSARVLDADLQPATEL